jgi:hypothetical protein
VIGIPTRPFKTFSEDLQRMLNLTLDIPAIGNNPPREGFWTALTRICTTQVSLLFAHSPRVVTRDALFLEKISERDQ